MKNLDSIYVSVLWRFNGWYRSWTLNTRYTHANSVAFHVSTRRDSIYIQGDLQSSFLERVRVFLSADHLLVGGMCESEDDKINLWGVNLTWSLKMWHSAHRFASGPHQVNFLMGPTRQAKPNATLVQYISLREKQLKGIEYYHCKLRMMTKHFSNTIELWLCRMLATYILRFRHIIW